MDFCHQKDIERWIQVGTPYSPYQSLNPTGHGLTPDENNISPIENLDNTIHRLYSYLSGSEGEPEADQPLTPRKPKERWERRRSRSPSPGSSPGSSPFTSSCEGDRLRGPRDLHPHNPHRDPHRDPQNPHRGTLDREKHRGTLDRHPDRHTQGTLDSGGSDGLYSHINDTATLPLHPPLPPIPPPPVESAPGPEVPPRGNLRHLAAAGTQTAPRPARNTYQEVEGEFQPQFLMQTASGNVFIPTGVYPGEGVMPPGSQPFPRTVPRTSSLPPPHQQAPPRMSTPDGLGPGLPGPAGFSQRAPLNDTHKTETSQGQVGGLPVSNSTDRQNVAFNANASLLPPRLPPLPQYPSVQNDFRDYSRFASTSYRMKKHFKGRCTWKCIAFILLLITVILTAVLAYFLAMKVGNLSWKLERHPVLNDLNHTTDAPSTKNKGATALPTPPVIVVQYPLGKRVEHTIPAHQFWRTQFYMPDPQFIKFNFSVPTDAVIGVYGRKNVQPSHAQYDFYHVMDGEQIKLVPARDKRGASVEGEETGLVPRRESRAAEDDESGGSAFYHYMETGLWYVFVYNDDEEDQTVAFIGQQHDHPESECPNDCLGRGDCVNGICRCFSGYTGWDCSQGVCPVLCQGNGIYVHGECQCYDGWKGQECGLPETECEDPSCSNNGKCVNGVCVCSPGFQGSQCEEEVCSLECVHGHCESQRCICEADWTGANCDQRRCDYRCEQNGYCNNGTCICKQGWNGKFCTLPGCPNLCNGNGACMMFYDGWQCSCRDGWKGRACEVAMETECENQSDDDRDGLIDCQDPDCCISISCKDSLHCLTAPDPMEILLRKQPPSSTASFYDRMRFLVEDDSVQSYATLSSFNSSQVSVIRGKVLSTDGSPLIGVRVSVVTQPLYGFTLTRELGLFDILVNGGGSVTLQFQRQPFQIQQTTVMVPWNRMVTMDAVTMVLEEEAEPDDGSCDHISHDHYEMKPVVLSTWQHTQLGACPSKSTIIPESQVLQESLQIPGTSVYLVYHSSETPGYMSTIMIQLTPALIPADLAVVHLRVAVEGLTLERVFEADSGLKYKFAWDRRNAYNQKVYGIVTASVGVGYQYASCKRIFWEMQSATLSGYDITSSEIGGWNLHIHHTYNFQEGILHKGDGTNIYLKERPRKVVTVLGNGKPRRYDCRGCDGRADENRLMSPVALASGRDGSLYVGDFNHIRKLSANRQEVESILQLNTPEVPYKYYMTVSPLDGRLYISDYQSLRLMRVKTMGAVRELSLNSEFIAGTGEQCVPGDKEKCGDGGPAINAKLFYPKGIAINKDGLVYFADGANIRMINPDDTINTLIGSQGQPTYWNPLPCDRVISTEEVTLHWPTALAINPLDDSLHILDNNVVLRLTPDMKMVVVAGRPLHCPPKNASQSSLLSEEQSGPRLATDVILENPQNIAFAPNGDLYIVESNTHSLNRVRVVNTDGTIGHYTGAKPRCDCREEECRCFNPKEELATEMLLHNPTAITVTPDNVLHIADMGNLRIHSIVATLPERDKFGQYEVLYPQTQEMYLFNRYGQHIATKNIITDQFLYNFTYNVNSYYGKLVKISDSGDNSLTIRRDYTTQAKEITPPGGQKCKFTMDNMGQLHVFVAADNSTTRFSYLSNTGLLATKETSEGLTFLYEYDDNGRLATVVQPTGERSMINTDVDPTGALVRLNTEHKDRILMATNGNSLSILHDQARMKVSYLHDGSLVVEYPFNMAVTLETSPHPLLSTEHQLQVKRKIILPENQIHRLEWRYYLRREGNTRRSKVIDKVGRRMRVGKTSSSRSRLRHGDPDSHGSESGYEGKLLMINGENLLTFEYDREGNSESVLNMAQEEIILVQYNKAGQPVEIIPEGLIEGVNVTYDKRGLISSWHRGEMSVVNTYDDKTGHLVERRLGGKVTYRFIYKAGNKPTDVILPSGKQYLLHYDDHGNLKSVVMPGTGKHKFHSLTTLGMHRTMYMSPEGHGWYIKDYDSAGKLRQVTHAGGHRRMTYEYTDTGEARAALYDWTDVVYEYHPRSSLLASINLTDRTPTHNHTCQLVYEPGDALVKNHHVTFQGAALPLVSASFGYLYDQYLRVGVTQGQVGEKSFSPTNITFDHQTGRVLKMSTFTIEYPRIHREVVRDSNVEIIKERNTYGFLSDMWYRFNNYVVFTLEVKYDTLGRISQWRRKVGSSDLKTYTYVYDIDGNVVEVLLNDQPVWKYEVDPNSNLVKINHHSTTKTVEIDAKNQIVTADQESYMFDKDGFLVQRGKEHFEYNSKGLLVRAFEPGKYNVYYFYDGLDRLVARKDMIGEYLTQYFYGNLEHQDRITHMYDHGDRKVIVLHHDNEGRLFSLERDGTFYYVALDPAGSPILVLNGMGGVVKQLSYDPLGYVVSDSAPDFRLGLGFQCGVADHITGLVFLGRRVYDPTVGRWTAPDYDGLLENTRRIRESPEMVNLYRHRHLVNPHMETTSLMTDLSSWLEALGYDLSSLIPQVTFRGDVRPGEDPLARSDRLIPVTSAFECAFRRDMAQFVEMSTVPRSVVTGQETGAGESFAPFGYIFGPGVVLSSRGGRVLVDVLDSASESLSALATTLLNNSEIVDLHLTVHGRDTHYLVKRTLTQAVEDVKALSLRAEDVIQGINVTVHRHHHTPEVMRYVDIRLHSNHTVVNLRYGTSVEHERRRVLQHAKERAVEQAWALEREILQAGMQGINRWTRPQREELLSGGLVEGFQGVHIRDVEKHPLLADDPKNIKFVSAT